MNQGQTRAILAWSLLPVASGIAYAAWRFSGLAGLIWWAFGSGAPPA